MASERQVSANRRNATLSTGPRTVIGKHRTRRNAFKHGLTARTIVEISESRAEFQLFCDKVASAYRPRSFLDQELITRLAALLWRLRRAHAIETGLLTIQANVQVEIRRKLGAADHAEHWAARLDPSDPIQLAHHFLRASNLNGEAFDRLSRYEIALWRQVAQILFLLAAIAKPHGNRPSI